MMKIQQFCRMLQEESRDPLRRAMSQVRGRLEEDPKWVRQYTEEEEGWKEWWPDGGGPQVASLS